MNVLGRRNMHLVLARKFRQTRYVGLALSLVVVTTTGTRAYERDVHYDLTRYLAIWAGFSEQEAEEIAQANQGLDDNPITRATPNAELLNLLKGVRNPVHAVAIAKGAMGPEYDRMTTAQRAYHFVDDRRLQELRNAAFENQNLQILGRYLHALQDTFSHSLMDYKDLPVSDKLARNLPIGNVPDDEIVGHFFYGHSVDKTYHRPGLAELMARYTYKELTQFRGSPNR